MIGLLTQPEEREIAAEFFELFKTPWEFARDGQCYDVLINTRDEDGDADAGLVLRYGAGQRAFDRSNNISVTPCRDRATFLFRGRPVPVYGPACAFVGGEFILPVEGDERSSLSCIIQGDKRMTVRIGYNLFDEIRFLMTTGQPPANAAGPTLELHIDLLRELITRCGIPLIEIPPVPEGHTFIACLTHDVDHPVLRNHRLDHTMFGFLYRATAGALVDVCRGRKSLGALGRNLWAVCRLPFVYLGFAEDPWRKFDRYLQFEEGLCSTFFVIPKKNQSGRQRNGLAPAKRAAAYSPDEIKPELDHIVAHGGEVALHGLDAWLDATSGKEERKIISSTLGVADAGVRMHWLYFDGQSHKALDQAGFTYDSTVGYNETVGFRAGTAQAYKPIDSANLLELPLHVMDTALFYPAYLDLSEADAQKLVCRLIDDVARFGGALTFNWHDRSIAPERLWDGSYANVIAELKRKGACFLTAGQAVSWFRKRRSAVIESITWENDRVCVKASARSGSDHLPGLRIRIHHWSARQSGSGVGYVDVTLDGGMDEDVLLESVGQFKAGRAHADSVGNPTMTPK